MDFVIRNNLIQIRETREQDIQFVLHAEQEQENAEYVGQWSFEQHLAAISDPNILHVILSNATEKDIGYAILKDIINPDNSIELMRLVITDKGNGYGKQSLAIIIKWCFENKKAHRLWLDVRAQNSRAQHVYETQGFIREGLLRECVKVGDTYQSLIVMSILQQDYNIV